MKVSFIATVFNEAPAIDDLLDSLDDQTKSPDEIVIVDAGSKDGTVEKIKRPLLYRQGKIKLLVKPGANRSVGRNLAVKAARNELVAVSDAGCRLKPDWLKLITAPLRKKAVDAVAGFYLPEVENVFQLSSACFLVVPEKKIDPKTFLPSSRSVAFKKSAWAKAGGYPEKLKFAEDLVFAKRLRQHTRMVTQKTALVHWRQANSLLGFFSQNVNYTSGSVEAVFAPHLKKNLTVPIRYLIFTALPLLFPIYLLWPIKKFIFKVKHPLALVYLPLLQVTADMAVLVGLLKGLLVKYS